MDLTKIKKMSRTREIILEAINPVTKILNGIVKKMNYIESSIVIHADSYEEVKDYIRDISAYHSSYFDDLPKDKQEELCLRLYDRLNIDGKKEKIDESEDLQEKIYEYLKANGSIMYPMKGSAKKLADALLAKKHK